MAFFMLQGAWITIIAYFLAVIGMTFNIWEFIMQSRRQADMETKMRNRWETQPCLVGLLAMFFGMMLQWGVLEQFMPLWLLIVICHAILAGSSLHPVMMIYVRLMLYYCMQGALAHHLPILAISPKGVDFLNALSTKTGVPRAQLRGPVQEYFNGL